MGLVSFRTQQPFSLGVQPPNTGGDGGAAEIQEAQPPLIASPPPSKSHPRASTLGVSPFVKGLTVTRSHSPCTLENELAYYERSWKNKATNLLHLNPASRQHQLPQCT